MDLRRMRFSDVDLDDAFFGSLKEDYPGFSDWFAKKAAEEAYVFYNDRGGLDGFLYLKVEDEPVVDVRPSLPHARRLKVGTFKINAHGTRLGERFLKKVFDHAVDECADEIYVTIFEKHRGLISLFEKYGFIFVGHKESKAGTEVVLLRNLYSFNNDPACAFPIIRLSNRRKHLLAIYPKFHTRLFPDSILKNEPLSTVQDVSHTNSIHKVYLCAMHGALKFKTGDSLVIYRTSDAEGPAHYRSVATSVCTVEEMRTIHEFDSKAAFMKYCQPYSVFTNAELDSFYKTKKYPFVIRFTYNAALKKRLTRKTLIEEIGLPPEERWGILPLSNLQFLKILKMG